MMLENFGIIFVMALSIGSFAIAYYQFNEKGVLLNNEFLYSSKEERLKMDKKPYYMQSAIVFTLIGIVFALIDTAMITHVTWIFYLVLIVVMIAIVYAITSTVMIHKRNSNK